MSVRKGVLTFVPVLVRFRIIKVIILHKRLSCCGCHSSGGGGGCSGGDDLLLLAFLLPSLLSLGLLLALGFLGGLGSFGFLGGLWLFLSFPSTLSLRFSTYSLYLKDR